MELLTCKRTTFFGLLFFSFAFSPVGPLFQSKALADSSLERFDLALEQTLQILERTPNSVDQKEAVYKLAVSLRKSVINYDSKIQVLKERLSACESGESNCASVTKDAEKLASTTASKENAIQQALSDLKLVTAAKTSSEDNSGDQKLAASSGAPSAGNKQDIEIKMSWNPISLDNDHD